MQAFLFDSADLVRRDVLRALDPGLCGGENAGVDFEGG